MTLLEKLIAKQRDLNLSDAEFADKLGISRALWTNTRGGLPIGMKVLRGVVREFPTLTDDVIFTVASYSTKSEQVAS